MCNSLEVKGRGASFSLRCAGLHQDIPKAGDEDHGSGGKAANTSSNKSEFLESFLLLVSAGAAAAALGWCEWCTDLAHEAKGN